MSVELVNPDIDRVDAVSGPATGIPFLMFKSAETPAVVVEKAADDAEDLAEEAAGAEDANVDGAPVSDEAIAAAEPGDAAWEAVDAAKARVATAGLAVLQKLVAELAQREDAEEPYSSDAFDLMDAGDALDFALGVLARFAVTEQLEADDAAEAEELASSRASGLLKALHLEIHEKPEEGAAPAAPHEAPVAAPAPVEDAIVPEAAEAPAAPEAPVPGVKPEDVLKAAEGVLPAGLMELLTTFVEGYTHYTEAQNSGAEEEASAEAPEAPAAPVADAIVPEAPAAPAEHAEPAEAPAEAPAEHAPAEAEKAPEHAPAEAEKAPEEDPAEKFKKSMEDAIAEAVAKATEPLLKQIDVLERTPVDSGPLLAGQTPGNAGMPLVRGQEEGAVAKGLVESAAAQTAPGTNPLAEGIKTLYKSIR